MGTHGRTGLSHLLLGSIAERTLRTAPCPVLAVREALVEVAGTEKAAELAHA
jgi:nucleotide-binding universal stress UspA family protein